MDSRELVWNLLVRSLVTESTRLHDTVTDTSVVKGEGENRDNHDIFSSFYTQMRFLFSMSLLA